MRVLVCGGRDFCDVLGLWATLDHHHAARPFSVLIHGKCERGADTIADAWAKARSVPIISFAADWNTYGNAAGPLRNARMLIEGKPDLVIAFPGNNGTANMCRQARKARVPVLPVLPVMAL